MMSRWRPPDLASLGGCWLPPERQWQLIILLVAVLSIASSMPNPHTKVACTTSNEDEEMTVDCTNKTYDHVPHMLNPRLIRLKLINQRIRSLSNIDVYTSMRYLDLSQNLLTALGEPLPRLPNLSVVIVRENKFTALRASDLAGLKSLKRLDISKNHIARIEAGTFTNSPLTQLDLSENSLSELSLGSLQGLSQLQWLNLKDNKFIAVPSALIKLRQLNYLDLSFNSFGDIPPNSLPDVKILHLERCDLSNTSFLSNSSAVYLDISANRFATVPRPLPAKLGTLILDANPIQTLNARSLSHVPYLKNFTLSSCKELRSVHVDAFVGNSELREIRLESDVSLKVLDSRMLRSLNKLEVLSVRRSGLQTIHSDHMSWHTLKRVDFRDNPFKCDCSLSWLRQLVQEYDNSTVKKRGPFDNETMHITCAEPKMFAGKLIIKVPKSEFECGTSPLFLLIAIPLGILALLATATVVALLCWRHRLPRWLPCPRSKDKTAPTHNSSTKHQFLEKTYMVPGDDYDGIYHLQRNAPVRLIPVTEL